MRSQIVVATDAGILVLHDSAAKPAAGAAQREVATLVREAAEAGGLFFGDAEDALHYRAVVTDEELPPELHERMEPAGGSFLLEVPTGRIEVRSGESWVDSGPAAAELEVPPGTYALRVFTPKPFDGAAYDRDMIALAGADAWRLRKRVDALGLAGCLIVPALVLVWLVRPLRFAFSYVLAALLVSWALYLSLRLLPAYRAVDRQVSEYGRSQPNYAFTLKRVTSAEGLAGGGMRG